MSNNRHFDEYIKEQFRDYSPDVHPRIWENIVAGKNKKKPAGFWVSMLNNRNKLLILGLIIALSSGGAWLYYDNINAKPATANESGSSSPRKHNYSSSYVQPASGTTANIKTEPTVPANGNTSNNNISAIAETAPGNSPLLTAGKFNAGIIPADTETEDEAKQKPVKRFDNKRYYTGLGNVLVNTTAGSMDEDEDAFAGQGTLLGRLTFNAEKYIARRNTGKDDQLKFRPIMISVPDCPGLEKDAAGNKRYFEFYAGPDYAIRSLHDTGNSSYLQQRRESASFKSAFSAGVRYTKVFNNSMSVRAGINFSQINEKFRYSQGNIVQVTYIINANGDTVGSYTTTGTRYKTTINRYRTIDIPLVAGYELGNGKLHANINAGAVINIYSWQKGDVIDMSGNPVSITTGKGSSQYQFRTNAGVGFIGAVSVYYKLNDRMHIMAEPYFRYNFTPMNKENMTLKQKYQTAGLRLGLRFDLD